MSEQDVRTIHDELVEGGAQAVERADAALELGGWWKRVANREIDAVVPKAIEYGADDLVVIGQELALLMGRTVGDEEATELGIYFYELGKMARWRSAIREGRRVSDDTLHDIGVYIRMAQRNREVGSWPGV